MGKLLNIFFIIFFVILFPLGEIVRIDLPNTVAGTATDIGVGILSILFFLQYFLQKKKTRYALVKPLFLFIVICVLSLAVNVFVLKTQEFLVAFLYLIRWIFYTTPYFIIKSLDQEYKNKLPWYLLFTGFIVLLIGYIQYFLYPSLRNLYYLGWDVHLYRMFGSFLDPNFLGAFLVLYFLFLVGNGFKPFPTQLILSVLTIVGIVLTYSRSAYVMLAVGVAVFFFLKKPNKLIIAGSLVLLIIGGISFFGLTKYSEGTNLLRINSTKARITTSQNALIIFQKNPLLGVGFNAYRYAQRRYGFVQQKQSTATIDHGGAGTDNSFLFVLATTGILGFLAYVYLWVKILCLAVPMKHSEIVKLLNCYIAKGNNNGTLKQWNNNFSPVLTASAIALFVDSFFINSLFYPFIMVWMWTLIGLAEFYCE